MLGVSSIHASRRTAHGAGTARRQEGAESIRPIGRRSFCNTAGGLCARRRGRRARRAGRLAVDRATVPRRSRHGESGQWRLASAIRVRPMRSADRPSESSAFAETMYSIK